MSLRPRSREVEKIMADGWDRATAEGSSLFEQLRLSPDIAGSTNDFINRGFGAWAHSMGRVREANRRGDRMRAAYYLAYAAGGRKHAAIWMSIARNQGSTGAASSQGALAL
jgi:hypothetical protein